MDLSASGLSCPCSFPSISADKALFGAVLGAQLRKKGITRLAGWISR